MCRLYGCAKEKLAEPDPGEQALRDMAEELGLSADFVVGGLNEELAREEAVTSLADKLCVPPEVLGLPAANHWTALDPSAELRRTLPPPSITRGGIQWPADHSALEREFATWQPPAREGPDQMSDDTLRQALRMLAGSARPNPAFDMITWCADEHVLSFRRVGGTGWVNVWLHARGEDEHQAETNAGCGGRNPRVLWVDGESRDGQWVINSPRRRLDEAQRGGAFGRDSYACRRIEAVGADWIVTRTGHGEIGFSTHLALVAQLADDRSYCSRDCTG